MIPLLAVGILDEEMLHNASRFGKGFAALLGKQSLIKQGLADSVKLREQGLCKGPAGDSKVLLSVVGVDRFTRLLQSLFDESKFLSPYGLRSLSAVHKDEPYVLHLDGTTATIDYEPAESTTAMFGGNSNWRGPIWFPVNYLLISCLDQYYEFFGDELTVEYPAGSGVKKTLKEIADDLRDRMISIFTRGTDGRRPCYGWVDRLQNDPAWRDNIVFNEYFHGDNGAGLGASHQTGWTGLIADIIRRRHGAVPRPDNMNDLIGEL
jgi:hypothetical protein